MITVEPMKGHKQLKDGSAEFYSTSLIRVDFYSGYITLRADWIVTEMKMMDLDKFMRLAFKNKESMYDLFDQFAVPISDEVLQQIKFGALQERRAWMIIKRLREFGFMPDWTQERIHTLFIGRNN